MSLVFSSKYRVYYEDTDIGGIVYHANYLKFCERARTDFVREVLSFSQVDALQVDKKCFVVTKLQAKFIAPAHFEEELTVTCIPYMLKKTSLQMYQEVFNAKGDLLFAMLSTIAYINLDTHRLCSLDASFTNKMQEYLKEDLKINC